MQARNLLVTPLNDYFIKVHQSHVDICDGCFACAAIIGALNYIANGQPGAYVVSRELLKRHLAGAINIATVTRHVDDLAARGYVTVENRGRGEDKVYQLNFDQINEAVAALPPVFKIERGVSTFEIERDPCSKSNAHVFDFERAYKEEKEVEEFKTKEETPIPPFFFPQNQKTNSTATPSVPEKQPSPEATPPPIPPPPSPAARNTVDIQEDEDVITFVNNAYRQSRGAKLENLKTRQNTPLRESIESKERSYGMASFRESLWNYLATSDEFLKTNKWPIRVFLKHIDRYEDSPAVKSYGGNFESETASPSLTTPQIALGASTAQKQASAAPQNEAVDLACKYVDIWNIMVPLARVDCEELLQSTKRKVAASGSYPDLEKHFETVCSKSKRMVEAGVIEGVTFAWLFVETKAGFNWQSVLEGKFSWAEKPKAAGGAKEESAAGRLMRRYQEEEKAKAKEQ